MDTVFLRDLRVETTIGTGDEERTSRRELRLDLEMGTDAARAAATDDLALALDYQAVAERVRAFAAAAEFRLVETFAERCADLVRREFGVSWLRLTVRKPRALPTAEEVGIAIERGVRSR